MASAITLSGPKGLPLVGNMVDFVRDPLGFSLKLGREYGDIIPLNFLGKAVYLLNNPQDIEYVLVGNNKNFIKDVFYHRPDFALLLGNGLVTSDGDFWLRQRRLAQPAFHRERIANYSQTMTAYTEEMLAGWRDGQTRNIHTDMMALTLRVVAKTLYDTDVAREAREVGVALTAVMDKFGSGSFLGYLIPLSWPTPANIHYKRAMQRLDDIVYALIRERRKSGKDSGDLLSMLLAAQDDDGSQMSDKQLRDEVMTLFLAGHETTALALSWAWYLLGQHPDVAAKLHAELQMVLDGRTPTLADLPKLRYTDKVITEVMRLYPPVWVIGREAVNDFELGGVHIAKGAQVQIMQWVTHRNPRYFAHADEFDPDRWSDEMKKQLPKYAYFPFGGGPRLCIGQQFAQMEAALMLATIAQRYQLELVPSHKVTPEASLTLRPHDGIKVVLHAR